MRDYRGGEHKKPPYSFNIAPTYLQSERTFNLDDYGKKGCKTESSPRQGLPDAKVTDKDRCSPVR